MRDALSGTDTPLIDDTLREAARFGKITDPQRLSDDLAATPARLQEDAAVLLDSLSDLVGSASKQAAHG